MKKLLIIDTETTGLDPNVNHIWQIAAYYRNSKGEWSTINLKCCPCSLENVTNEALQVCRTSIEELTSFPDAKSVYNQFRNFLIQETSDGEKLVWVGYNCKFDMSFMESFFKYFDQQDSIYRFFSRHHVDMLDFSRLLYTAGVLDSPSLRLETIYKLFGQGTETAHDALEDARITTMYYNWIESHLQSTITKRTIS
jgi:DNA polymerase III alpha subunit (gram-positive type)